MLKTALLFLSLMVVSATTAETNTTASCLEGSPVECELMDGVKIRQVDNKDYVLAVQLPRLMSSARNWVPSFFKPVVAGKSSFLTGFGLGFLAFGLKKLLLPLIIGGQIVKSVLIAMFLPSILGGLGKLVGKGVSTFASASGSSGSGHTNAVDDFDFKDNMHDDAAGSESQYSGTFTYPDPGYKAPLMPGAVYAPATTASNKYQSPVAAPKVSYVSPVRAENYYTRHKQQDYKVFQNIPSSSMLLTNYDPFYSPLLSRLDSIFKQLGYDSEACRERLVCAMYKNPAKFAPYSNLVSAQLSRELNELRKPSTDNPEILRFFRYMKAAKDGQDGLDCFTLHPGCVTGSNSSTPMIKTYNEINKLVQARRLKL